MERRRKILSNLKPPEKFYGDTLSAFDPFAKPDIDHDESDLHDISSYSSNYPGQQKPKHSVFDNTAQKLEFEEFLENQEMILFNTNSSTRKRNKSKKMSRISRGNSPKSTLDPNAAQVDGIKHGMIYNYKSSRRIIEVNRVRESLNFSMKNKFMKDKNKRSGTRENQD